MSRCLVVVTEGRVYAWQAVPRRGDDALSTVVWWSGHALSRDDVPMSLARRAPLTLSVDAGAVVLTHGRGCGCGGIGTWTPFRPEITR
jgi:hypothetical protein